MASVATAFTSNASSSEEDALDQEVIQHYSYKTKQIFNLASSAVRLAIGESLQSDGIDLKFVLPQPANQRHLDVESSYRLTLHGMIYGWLDGRKACQTETSLQAKTNVIFAKLWDKIRDEVKQEIKSNPRNGILQTFTFGYCDYEILSPDDLSVMQQTAMHLAIDTRGQTLKM